MASDSSSPIDSEQVRDVPSRSRHWFSDTWAMLVSRPWTFYLYLFSVLASVTVATNNWDINDLYWHTMMGEDIVRNGRLTGAEEWTFGPVGDPSWVTTQTVSELLMYGWWEIFGWNGFLLARIVLSLVFSVSVFYAIRWLSPKGSRFDRNKIAFLLSGIVIYVFAGSLQERPQTLSLILAVPLGVVLLRVLHMNRWPHPVAVFFIVMVWGWFHGSAILVGPLLLLAFLLRVICMRLGRFSLPTAGFGNSSPRRWFFVLSAAFIAPIVNPIGIEIYRRAFLIREASQDFISEWRPLLATSFLIFFFFSLVIIWAIYTAVKLWRRESWRLSLLEGLWIGALFTAGVTSIRIFIFFILLLLPLFARRLTQLWRIRKKPVLSAHMKKEGFLASFVDTQKTLALLILAVFAFTVPFGWAQITGVPTNTPVTIIAGLARENERKVFVDWNLNGRVQLFGGEDVSTFVDGRTDRYGKEGIKKYSDIVNTLPGWMDTWRKYPVTDIIVEKDASLADRAESLGWRKVCEDKDYVWYAKEGLPGSCVQVERLQTTGVG